MNKQDEFEFCFKGGRNYVHGTDIYEKIITYLTIDDQKPNVTNLDIWFRKITTHGLSVSKPAGKVTQPSDHPAVTIRYKNNNSWEKAFLFENSKLVECRYPYDEIEITDHAVIAHDQRMISSQYRKGFSTIEMVVALNKKLVQTCITSENGKWLFARLKTFLPLPKTYSLIELSLAGKMNSVFTRSSIIIDKDPIGEIFFSLMR